MRERAYVSTVAEEVVAVALVAALKLSPTAIDQSAVHDCRPVTMTATVTINRNVLKALQHFSENAWKATSLLKLEAGASAIC